MPKADVAIRATPTTRAFRPVNSSGCSAASVMSVIPPMECATITSGPSWATASIRVNRSRPSWSMVALPGTAGPERPWPRWS